jgi:beta-lactam-binding protein with PASTA domain
MNFIQFITTRRFLKHFGISLLISLILGWITLSLLRQYTKHGSSIEVPNLVGLSDIEISQLENLDDFELLVVDSVYDYEKPGGMIVSQDPQPKSKVKPGRTIYLSMVAFLPEQVKMPALIDLSLRQAKALLQTYGLKLGSVKFIPDPAKNAVLQVTHKGRSIQPGAMIRKGSMIDLFIGSGNGGTEAQIPFLIGKSRREAISEIIRLGMVPGEEIYSGNSDSINARVYLQEPFYVYGLKIPLSSTINLTYKSDESFDFENYIQNLEIDTIQVDSISQ